MENPAPPVFLYLRQLSISMAPYRLKDRKSQGHFLPNMTNRGSGDSPCVLHDRVLLASVYSLSL